jgi:hypothetical protein
MGAVTKGLAAGLAAAAQAVPGFAGVYLALFLPRERLAVLRNHLRFADQRNAALYGIGAVLGHYDALAIERATGAICHRFFSIIVCNCTSHHENDQEGQRSFTITTRSIAEWLLES